MTLIVIVEVEARERERFHAYENRAARILERHGGRIVRRLVIPLDAESFREIHLVEFADDAGFASFQADPELLALRAERATAVRSTDIIAADDAPPFPWRD